MKLIKPGKWISYIRKFWEIKNTVCRHILTLNPLRPKDLYMSRTAPLTSKRRILYIYSTNIATECFKHALYSPFFSLQSAVCFIMLTCLVPVLFTFYIRGVLKLKRNNSGAKGLNNMSRLNFVIKSHFIFCWMENWTFRHYLDEFNVTSQTYVSREGEISES